MASGIIQSLTTRWAAAAKVEAQENSIFAQITSGAYQVDSVNAKTISVIGVTTPTIANYEPGVTSLTYEGITDNKVDIDIDKYKEFSFSVDEVEVAQAAPDYVPAAIIQASKALALSADTHVLGLYTQADADNIVYAVDSELLVTVDNVQALVSKMARTLREQHVARGDMYLTIPPFMMDLLNQAVGARLTDNAETLSFGMVYNYAGLKIIESTECPSGLGTGTDESIIMAFSTRAIPFVSQIQKVETLKNPDAFGDLVRGLFVFGADTVFPKELAYASVREA